MSGVLVVGALCFGALGDEVRCLRVEGDPELIAGLAETGTTATDREACERIAITRTPEGQLRLTRRREQRTVADLGTARAVVASWRRLLQGPSALATDLENSGSKLEYGLQLGAHVGVDDLGHVWHGLQLGGDLLLDDWVVGLSAAVSQSGHWDEIDNWPHSSWAARDFQILAGFGHRFRIGRWSLTPRISAGWAHQDFREFWNVDKEHQPRLEAELGAAWRWGPLALELRVAGGPFEALRGTPRRALRETDEPVGGEQVGAGWRGRVGLGVALLPTGAP